MKQMRLYRRRGEILDFKKKKYCDREESEVFMNVVERKK